MNQYILLQNKSRSFMLVGYPDRYHLIDVNRQFSWEKEEAVLNSSPSDTVLEEMELSFETLRKSELRGVAIGGSCAGDVLVLYTKSKKLPFQLSDDYQPEDLEYMFSGVERFLPPQKKNTPTGPKPDWHREIPDKAVNDRVHMFVSILNAASFAVFLFTMIFGRLNTILSLACIVIAGIALALYLRYPLYFSMMDSKEYRKAGYKANVHHLGFSLVYPSLALTLRANSDFICLDSKTYLVVCGIFSAVVVLLFLIRSRECRENISWALIMVTVVLTTSFGYIGHVNHLTNFDRAEPQVCTIMHASRQSHSKGVDSYSCTVRMPSGEEVKLPISARVYSRLQIGGKAEVCTDIGGLDIEYAYFVGIVP